jgi:HD-GYP domain-containing protein (c-di-GMP phosphodiesterase class II)
MPRKRQVGRTLRAELRQAEREREELNRIGVALSSERDVDKLLELILQKSREITGADAGSLYLIEESAEGERQLRFKLTQNDSRQFPFREAVFALTENSTAGYAALHGEPLNLPDAYRIPRRRPYRFDESYDEESGYRTRSLLSLPMKNPKGEVLGILQLINCKRRRGTRLKSRADVERAVQAFPEQAVRLAMSLASQAAVALENSKLYDEIASLFEGFVTAAVTAIEQRDPTTSGHSLRVSTFTQGLAETVDAAAAGPYARTRFSREQMKEIRYAALLHDFGKVGVREEVLVKAKKLYPSQLELVRHRFDYIRKDIETGVLHRKIEALLERPREEALAELARLDRDSESTLREIDDCFQFILEANEPTVLQGGHFERLLEIARRSYRDTHGLEHPYLDPDEVRFLSIPRGSLDPAERAQIESHVAKTFRFLSQIPWTSDLKQVPSIARAHHEKLNGTGYPYKLHGDEIPLPAKMMTICDIYDALSASDRPYKKAVPVDRALSILDVSVRDKELDPELFRLFLEARIYERVAQRP